MINPYGILEAIVEIKGIVCMGQFYYLIRSIILY
jgi:hypothetical protein